MDLSPSTGRHQRDIDYAHLLCKDGKTGSVTIFLAKELKNEEYEKIVSVVASLPAEHAEQIGPGLLRMPLPYARQLQMIKPYWESILELDQTEPILTGIMEYLEVEDVLSYVQELGLQLPDPELILKKIFGHGTGSDEKMCKQLETLVRLLKGIEYDFDSFVFGSTTFTKFLLSYPEYDCTITFILKRLSDESSGSMYEFLLYKNDEPAAQHVMGLFLDFVSAKTLKWIESYFPDINDGEDLIRFVRQSVEDGNFSKIYLVLRGLRPELLQYVPPLILTIPEEFLIDILSIEEVRAVIKGKPIDHFLPDMDSGAVCLLLEWDDIDLSGVKGMFARILEDKGLPSQDQAAMIVAASKRIPEFDYDQLLVNGIWTLLEFAVENYGEDPKDLLPLLQATSCASQFNLIRIIHRKRSYQRGAFWEVLKSSACPGLAAFAVDICHVEDRPYLRKMIAEALHSGDYSRLVTFLTHAEDMIDKFIYVALRSPLSKLKKLMAIDEVQRQILERDRPLPILGDLLPALEYKNLFFLLENFDFSPVPPCDILLDMIGPASEDSDRARLRALKRLEAYTKWMDSFTFDCQLNLTGETLSPLAVLIKSHPDSVQCIRWLKRRSSKKTIQTARKLFKDDPATLDLLVVHDKKKKKVAVEKTSIKSKKLTKSSKRTVSDKGKAVNKSNSSSSGSKIKGKTKSKLRK